MISVTTVQYERNSEGSFLSSTSVVRLFLSVLFHSLWNGTEPSFGLLILAVRRILVEALSYKRLTRQYLRYKPFLWTRAQLPVREERFDGFAFLWASALTNVLCLKE